MCRGRLVSILIFIWLLSVPVYSLQASPDNKWEAKRTAFVECINHYFPKQLTDPHKKKRRSFSQFGYDLSFFRWQLFYITEFIDPNDFGQHSYGKPSPSEKNGVVYTCKGGFLDVSHLRAAADWTVYLTFKIINDNCGFELPEESGTLKLDFKNLDHLSVEDIVAMSQKIAHERLLWHEIVSWHYHAPNHLNSEQQSAFTPEDNYSNFLGTIIGKNIALRILINNDTLSYEEIATQEISKAVWAMQPLSIDACKQAYDNVDRYVQMQLPPEQRNTDLWWDSNIIFRDQRYVFKRYMHIGPVLQPWLVPGAGQLGCTCDESEGTLTVPYTTAAGVPFSQYYTFTITPGDILFYSLKSGKQVHPVFGPFTTDNLEEVVTFVGQQMEKTLLPGYDQRDHHDPVPSYGKVKRVEHANGIPLF